MSRDKKKLQIEEILLSSLSGGGDRSTVYCCTCRGEEKDDELGNRCEGCVRKEFYWGISKKYASEMAEEILNSLED